MIPPPILVRKINHLTDARYFAAMEVDWISMELNPDPASFAKWHALRDWVEGMKLLAEVESTDEDLIARTIIEAKPDGILLPKGTYIEIPTELILFSEDSVEDKTGMRIIQYDEAETIITTSQPHTVFMQAPWTLSLLEQILASGYKGGFCFLGGEEDAVGVRDYAEMDDMIYLIRESQGGK